MWYFSWILGVLLACSLGIINVLRLEAQEALAKENEVIDPLTQLLGRESMLPRLREKVDNSKRNGLPFSLLYISLGEFKQKQSLLDHELTATLLKVVEVMKQDIRLGVDLAARVGSEDFLLALPGAPLDKAELLAEQIRQNIYNQAKTPDNVPVEVNIGVAEYSRYLDAFREDQIIGMEEVEALLNIAIGKSMERTAV